MSVIINDLKIISNGSQITIDVETNVGYNISSILLWTMSTFKDYTLAKNLTPFLSQINNKEVLIINANDIGLTIFEDICFIEVHSTYVDPLGCQDCQAPAVGVTYNLSKYYSCLLSYLTDLSVSQGQIGDNKANQMIITINMLIDNIIKAIEVGYYASAIDMIDKLKKLCIIKECKNCLVLECASCNNFIQI